MRKAILALLAVYAALLLTGGVLAGVARTCAFALPWEVVHHAEA